MAKRAAASSAPAALLEENLTVRATCRAIVLIRYSALGRRRRSEKKKSTYGRGRGGVEKVEARLLGALVGARAICLSLEAVGSERDCAKPTALVGAGWRGR